DSGLSFALAGTDCTVNSDWFVSNVEPDLLQQSLMKTLLRRGGVSTLAVRLIPPFSRSTFCSDKGLLDYATFPWTYDQNPLDDGVVFLLYRSKWRYG
ncbi:hypothetical protein BC827DRAFT_1282837, partial [Russula dissimulans]